ncbi:hypothetical protein [Streptomyces prasinus]|uniref:hypothetical protein n=1 Tax=Streptomyces prasinus TaxID=67345 RepID=UPI00368E0B11
MDLVAEGSGVHGYGVDAGEAPLLTGTVHSLFPHALPGRTAWEQTGQRGSATGQRACPRSFGD